MSNIDRLPTQLETFFGFVFTAFLAGGLGFILYHAFLIAYKHPKFISPTSISIVIVLIVIFVWSTALLVRIIFGKPKRSSYLSQSLIGWFAVIIGASLSILSVISSQGTILNFLQGLALLLLGLAWVGWARDK